MALNMVPLYTNETGYAESFLFCDSHNSYSINSAGDVTVYTITNVGGNATSINPNYKAPAKLSVVEIVLIVISIILALSLVGHWFVARRNLKSRHKKEFLEEHSAGIALEPSQDSYGENTVFISNREASGGRAAENQLLSDVYSASTVAGPGRGDGLDLVAFSTHPSPTIVTTNVDSS